ncbi:hypothetical protein CEXT_164541, partial [Caerostris extrusa]
MVVNPRGHGVRYFTVICGNLLLPGSFFFSTPEDYS